MTLLKSKYHALIEAVWANCINPGASKATEKHWEPTESSECCRLVEAMTNRVFGLSQFSHVWYNVFYIDEFQGSAVQHPGWTVIVQTGLFPI